jgi:hypothetical protein
MASSTLITAASNSTTADPGDRIKPYSFQDWKSRNENTATNDTFKLYTAYVNNWYINNNQQQIKVVDVIKNYYKNFLLEVGIAPRTPAEKLFFENIVIDNNTNLQAVIVAYARRMKDIAVYLSSKRNQIGYTKLKYNLVGTNVSLERLFYTYLLNAFTRKTTATASIITSLTITDPNILDALPLLPDISKTFTIEIQELYDTSNYLDRDPNVSSDKYVQQESNVPTELYTSGDYDIPVDYLIAEVISAAATT